TTVGDGNFRAQPVASLHQVANDPQLLLGKLLNPSTPTAGKVDNPYYPADVAASALADIASLFTTKADNWLYGETRYARGHSMDFVLRPGETMTRYFDPETPKTYYLPYKWTEKGWQQFPTPHPDYGIFTANGPESYVDARRWASGRLEFKPALWAPASFLRTENLRLPDPALGEEAFAVADATSPAAAVFEVQSPYAIINGRFDLRVVLPDETAAIRMEISTDLGVTWQTEAARQGPFEGQWLVAPRDWLTSADGSLTALSGKYGYFVRLGLTGAASVSSVMIDTRFQLNPRSLPALVPGTNRLGYQPGLQRRRRALPVRTNELDWFAYTAGNLQYLTEDSQGFVFPAGDAAVDITFELASPDGAPLTGFDAGGRFLDLKDGLAPDKLTAEPRASAFANRSRPGPVSASLEWGLGWDGPFTPLWQWQPSLEWKDGNAVRQTLRWPEVDSEVRSLPPDTLRVLVRYRLQNVGIDEFRLAGITTPAPAVTPLLVTHVWTEDGAEKRYTQQVPDSSQPLDYTIEIPAQAKTRNRALILACPPLSPPPAGQQ
ncbi:MAG: hypothetical protein HZB13_17040, partial [Acidobacteria bacterium]|nr:hypothetical protein [Acidobacteriota bacterium]